MKTKMLAAVIFVMAMTPLMPMSSAGASVPTKTPKACVRALDAADDMNSISIEVLRAMADHFDAIQQAATDAQSRYSVLDQSLAFVQGVQASVQKTTAAVKDATPRMGEARARYDANASKCRRKA